jgi:tetratricopeptide (TPR) repeat protein
VFLLAPAIQIASHAGEIEDAKEEVRKYPDDAEAHFLLGYAYDELGKYKEAIKSYKQAIRIDPDYAEAHLELGIAYNITVKYKKAIKAFKESIRIDPDFAEAHINLGLAYVKFGIAGPCAVEDQDQINYIAEKVKKAVAIALRGGAFKLRISPFEA